MIAALSPTNGDMRPCWKQRCGIQYASKTAKMLLPSVRPQRKEQRPKSKTQCSCPGCRVSSQRVTRVAFRRSNAVRSQSGASTSFRTLFRVHDLPWGMAGRRIDDGERGCHTSFPLPLRVVAPFHVLPGPTGVCRRALRDDEEGEVNFRLRRKSTPCALQFQ